MTADDDVDFLVHVMKTGGTSFLRYLQEVVGKERLYPTTAVQDELGWPPPSRPWTVDVGRPVVRPDGMRELVS